VQGYGQEGEFSYYLWYCVGCIVIKPCVQSVLIKM
jgi:hypothetical protein